jgi:hypothetical protein
VAGKWARENRSEDREDEIGWRFWVVFYFPSILIPWRGLVETKCYFVSKNGENDQRGAENGGTRASGKYDREGSSRTRLPNREGLGGLWMRESTGRMFGTELMARDVGLGWRGEVSEIDFGGYLGF